MVETDIIIIGAGPVGLFTVFEAGLLKLRCHLIDVLPQPGGQLTEIYPKKPIYDIPGFPEVLAGELINNLMKQAEPFKPGFTLGEKAVSIEKTDNNGFIVTTESGLQHKAPNVAIAGGLGVFEPRKPPIPNLAQFERKGLDYMVKDPEAYRGKRLVISGGGDSALDWTLFLADVAEHITLLHRRTEFRGHLDSVQKVMDLAAAGKIDLLTQSEAVELNGQNTLEAVGVRIQGQDDLNWIEADHFLPLFGLSPKLGPIADWGLALDKNAIEVDTFDYQTSVPGIYAIGDINTYPGKLKLILCGFHEATLMVQSAFKRIYPDKNLVLKYTTVNGVNGF
ncbi:MAG: NAD(P)/FAD-dependent oxidoreductase [Bacteroidetes bacterium]|nr:NAD(P)/FAD-dependent oxidoreductase [Bacteroidota bacterium]MDA0942869.1 NAD(P)/FAD-dependent oxidoreductase [Bacteroidota bacterium]MDA1110927.1 NAD(P)/FAD-dependent oxidoreductase [Bacteroidota bacterium]